MLEPIIECLKHPAVCNMRILYFSLAVDSEDPILGLYEPLDTCARRTCGIRSCDYDEDGACRRAHQCENLLSR